MSDKTSKDEVSCAVCDGTEAFGEHAKGCQLHPDVRPSNERAKRYTLDALSGMTENGAGEWVKYNDLVRLAKVAMTHVDAMVETVAGFRYACVNPEFEFKVQPDETPAELTEAEQLLSAWADLLPPNGNLYFKHTKLARDYFARRALKAPATSETPASTDELLDNCALRGELELTVEHLQQANSACEAASKRLDEMTAHMHSIQQFAWICHGSDGDGGGLLELGFHTAGDARAAHDALIAIPAPKTSVTASASTGDNATPSRPSPSPVECPMCRTELAFDGDICGLCNPDFAEVRS